MKGFKDTTKTQSGHNFTRTSTPVRPHTRAMPMKKFAEGGKVDLAQDRKTVATGVHKHERNMHPGKPLTKMARGGSVPSHSSKPLIGC